MINLEKIKLRKCQLLPSLQEDPPLHHTSTTFFNFPDPPLRGSQLKFTPPSLTKRRGPAYEHPYRIFEGEGEVP